MYKLNLHIPSEDWILRSKWSWLTCVPYNDSYNKEVIRVDLNGKMTRLPYQRATLSLEESFEGVHAANIYEEAETKDIALGTYYDDNDTPDDTSVDAPDAQYFTNRDAKTHVREIVIMQEVTL